MNSGLSLNRLKLFFPLFVALALLSTVNASVLNFDELAAPPSGSTNLPANYGGFNWDFGYLRYDFLYPSGYYYGAGSCLGRSSISRIFSTKRKTEERPQYSSHHCQITHKCLDVPLISPKCYVSNYVIPLASFNLIS